MGSTLKKLGQQIIRLVWYFFKAAVMFVVSTRGLPTDRYMWSDASGLHECTKANTKPPSPHWTWVSGPLHPLQTEPTNTHTL